MEIRFGIVCTKCGKELDVVGREMDKYCDELTIMVKPCRFCLAIDPDQECAKVLSVTPSNHEDSRG